jgi:hypothetical protein
MTPMTGGIPYGEKNRPVFLFRFFKRVIIPGMPIHGIRSMLKQIGAFFMDQSVRQWLPTPLRNGVYTSSFCLFRILSYSYGVRHLSSADHDEQHLESGVGPYFFQAVLLTLNLNYS